MFGKFLDRPVAGETVIAALAAFFGFWCFTSGALQILVLIWTAQKSQSQIQLELLPLGAALCCFGIYLLASSIGWFARKSWARGHLVLSLRLLAVFAVLKPLAAAAFLAWNVFINRGSFSGGAAFPTIALTGGAFLLGFALSCIFAWAFLLAARFMAKERS
jgi:hypothetical protein